MPDHNSPLTLQFLARARAALSSRHTPNTVDPARPVQPNAVTVKPVEPPAPTIRVSQSVLAPAAPSRPFCEPVELTLGLDLSAGAVKVFAVLHRTACAIAKARAYRLNPDVVTFHVPALVVAGLAGYTPRHTRRLVKELKAAGLVAGGPHASRVGLRSLWDGSIFAVKVREGEAVPFVTGEDWQHNWRPDFEADVVGKTGAAAWMSQLVPENEDAELLYRLVALAANTGVYVEQNPAEGSSADISLECVQDVVYRLGELPIIHARRRAALVSELAGALARLVDGGNQWKSWWAGTIWKSWWAHVEGRVGGLEALGGALARIEADRLEAPHVWRRPGAVLAARLRAA